ncbi:MAG: hypothetical protein KBT00_01650 [Bacteroidales bacterium]|nr:hypothetical protein [Candidatus Cacconaster merdequi]
MQKVIPNEILLSEVGRLLSEDIEVVLMTKGCSMLPFIHGEKDSVRLKKFPMDQIKVSDVVLAEIAPAHYVLHRVVSVDGDKLELMGDGNCRGHERCLRKNVLGTVVAIVRPSGREVSVPKARLWRKMLPLRPYILWFDRKVRRALSILKRIFR